MAAVWTALLLWGVALASEAQIASQPTVAIGAWVAVFSLPPAYSAGRCVGRLAHAARLQAKPSPGYVIQSLHHVADRRSLQHNVAIEGCFEARLGVEPSVTKEDRLLPGCHLKTVC